MICKIYLTCSTYDVAVLQDVLDDVVSVLILEELVGVLMKLLQDGLGLLRNAVLQNSLDHTTTIRMGRKRINLNRKIKIKSF